MKMKEHNNHERNKKYFKNLKQNQLQKGGLPTSVLMSFLIPLNITQFIYRNIPNYLFLGRQKMRISFMYLISR